MTIGLNKKVHKTLESWRDGHCRGAAGSLPEITRRHFQRELLLTDGLAFGDVNSFLEFVVSHFPALQVVPFGIVVRCLLSVVYHLDAVGVFCDEGREGCCLVCFLESAGEENAPLVERPRLFLRHADMLQRDGRSQSVCGANAIGTAGFHLADGVPRPECCLFAICFIVVCEIYLQRIKLLHLCSLAKDGFDVGSIQREGEADELPFAVGESLVQDYLIIIRARNDEVVAVQP